MAAAVYTVQECAGIDWVDGSKLGDLDFADDVALLLGGRPHIIYQKMPIF